MFLTQVSCCLYFVSASLEIWLKPFAEFYNFKLICTKAKFKNNLYTGKYDGVNCNHEQKVLRINQEINLKDFSEIFVFGDTQGDKGMLNLATKSHFQFFRKGL